VHRLDTDDGVRRLWWAIVLIAFLAVAVFVGRGGSRPKDPSLNPGSLPAHSQMYTTGRRA
jgi:hypothetical protein